MADMWREPVKVIADVLKDELGLDDGHIMLGFQRWGIPTDPGLYVALTPISTKPIGVNNYVESAGPNPEDGMTEVQQAVTEDLVQIDAMSFGDSARVRKEEILMALTSVRSLQAQAEHQFQIARIPTSFVNASVLEETANLQRFVATIIVKAIRTKTKAVEYFDTFTAPEVHANV